MSDLTVTKIRFRNGKWEGRISNAPVTGTPPNIRVLYLDQPVEQVALSEGSRDGEWELVITVPTEAIADGVHSFVITDAAADQTLAHFTLIGGDVAAEDMRCEVELLRAELDMLKRAFRRHCVETA
ncbi:hypothetical protein SM764_10290 [Pseudophaeobacter sp. 1A16562]|uniref:hypothetical protein n=1 Tax=Pseudophaeobacter sp. 1A16562 TaxID=3098143 RepID=UPI0034D6B499